MTFAHCDDMTTNPVQNCQKSIQRYESFDASLPYMSEKLNTWGNFLSSLYVSWNKTSDVDTLVQVSDTCYLISTFVIYYY